MRKVIAERYELGTLLGKGAVGRVYEAIDTHTGEEVAIKVLTQKEFAEAKEIIERFILESQALQKLRHPNIVHIIEYFQHQDEHYIVMELVRGGSLTNYIRKHHPLPIVKVLDIALELADALTRAHHLNIIHRDIKPGNVLLADDGTPRLTDFGVARIGESDMTQQGQVLGTLPYLSPESFLHRKVDSRSDIWSFGIVVYEMLTGSRPFDMEVPAAIITAILTQTVPRLEDKRPDIPVALVDLIYRMLEKSPEARIPSMRLVGAELEKIRRTVDVETTPPDYSSAFTTLVEPINDLQTHVPVSNNLPAQSTPFFGRTEAMSRLAEWFSAPAQRLMTIVGLGGVGKTRLALAAAQDNEILFPDGVFFVPLSSTQGMDQVIPAIAEALKLQFSGNDDPVVELREFVREKNCLIILDNLEHLPDATVTVSDLLSVAPHLKILTTSRERLRLKGESILELNGLELPSPTQSLEKMGSYPAVQLFIDSARRVQGDFKLTKSNAPQVASIIQLVDGLPLGLELAAAWLEVLSIEEVKDEIKQSLDFLRTDLRDVPERHRSMRAIFDYSWNLMTVDERDVFMKLSVFHGGFERQAAEKITDASLLMLSTLVNKSLIRRTPEGRYLPQELLREYAMELFGVFSDDLHETHDRHATFYADLLASQARYFGTKRDRESISTIDRDIENIRAAWRWAMQQENWDMLSEMLHPLAVYFHSRSMLREGHNTLRSLVDLLKDNPSQDKLYWKALLRSVWLLIRIGDLKVSYQQASDCLDFFENTPMTFEEILSLNCMAYARMMQGQYAEAVTLSSTALEKAYEIDDDLSLYMSLSTQGYAKYLNGDHVGAVELHEKLLHLNEEGRLSALDFAASLNSYGEIITTQGQYQDAKLLFENALEIFRNYRNRRGTALSLKNLAGINIVLGDTPTAKDQYQRAHRLSRRIGDRHGVGESLRALGNVATHDGKYDEAMQYHEQALKLRQELAHYQGVAESLLDMALTHMAKAEYMEAQDYCQQSADIRRELDDKAGLALALIWSGFAALRNEQLVAARERLQEAEAIINDHPTPLLRKKLRGAIVDFEMSSGNLSLALERSLEMLRADKTGSEQEPQLYVLAVLAHGYFLQGDVARAATIVHSILDMQRPVDFGVLKARQVLDLVQETPHESVPIEQIIAEVS